MTQTEAIEALLAKDTSLEAYGITPEHPMWKNLERDMFCRPMTSYLLQIVAKSDWLKNGKQMNRRTPTHNNFYRVEIAGWADEGIDSCPNCCDWHLDYDEQACREMAGLLPGRLDGCETAEHLSGRVEPVVGPTELYDVAALRDLDPAA